MSTKVCKIDNPNAVIGELAKRFQEKYGLDALDLFKPVLREYGYHAGVRLRKKMTDKGFAERVEGWMAPYIKTGYCSVLEEGPDHVMVRGTDCTLNLEGSNQALCDTCMSIDEGLLSALAEKEISIDIIKSMARGDECCLVRFSRIDS